MEPSRGGLSPLLDDSELAFWHPGAPTVGGTARSAALDHHTNINGANKSHLVRELPGSVSRRDATLGRRRAGPLDASGLASHVATEKPYPQPKGTTPRPHGTSFKAGNSGFSSVRAIPRRTFFKGGHSVAIGCAGC